MDGMIPLRRRTTNLIVLGCLGLTLVAFGIGTVALVLRPETRGVALVAWAVLGLGMHELTGEPWSRGNAALCAGFTLPLAFGGLAVYELAARFEHGLTYGVLGFGAMALLFFVFFVRALVASGSADYPYDD